MRILIINGERLRAVQLGMFAISSFLYACGEPATSTPKPTLRVVAISAVPDPHRIPYPNAAAICQCLDKTGAKMLVAIPAVKDRKAIPDFAKLEAGSEIKIRLIPWDERSTAARAMFIANDFKDLYDLPIYFGQSLDFP